MNITGVPAYNREVGAMRNAQANTDTAKRLIFIYPFGIDQSLANIPFNTAVKGDMDTIGDSLRAFFSVSVLKEIFTSNALNLVTLASTYERIEREPIKSNVLINSLIRGGSTNDSSNPFGPVKLDDQYIRSPYDINPQVDPSTLQRKIDEKFKAIKDSLRSDPRLKKMLPFMEVITLKNMLDVPVITGTAQFQLDTGTLFSFLAAAIIKRVRISKWGDIKNVISSLKNTPDHSIYDMYSVLSSVEGKASIPSSVLGKNLVRYQTPLEIQIKKLESNLDKADRENNIEKKRQIMAALEPLNKEYAMNNIANLRDTKIKELERSFLFMTDPQQLLIRYGLSEAASQSTYAAKKVTAQTELLFSRTKQQMTDFLGGADPLFSSIYMMLSPMEQLDSGYDPNDLLDPNAKKKYIAWNHTYVSMKDDLVNAFSDKFDGFMRDFKDYFDKSIEGKITDTSTKISDINRSCDGVREDFVSLMNFFNDTLSRDQVYPTFQYQDIEAFMTAIDKIQTKFTTVRKSTMDSIVRFFGTDLMKKIDNSLNSLLSITFDNFFTPFQATSDPTSALMARIYSVERDDNLTVSKNTGVGLNPMAIARLRNKHHLILTQMAAVAKLVIQTVFYLIFRINLCDYVQVADIEFSSAKADVLDLPNYCLVLPLEVVQALMVIYTKRDISKIINSNGGGFNPLNSSYIKGLVKTLRIQLDIPNLMVLDRKKNELYYSFRHFGKTAEKLKMQAVESFVNHHLKDNSSGMSQLYY